MRSPKTLPFAVALALAVAVRSVPPWFTAVVVGSCSSLAVLACRSLSVLCAAGQQLQSLLQFSLAVLLQFSVLQVTQLPFSLAVLSAAGKQLGSAPVVAFKLGASLKT